MAGTMTWVGLDVHARSTHAAAIDSMTGELVRKAFGPGIDEPVGWLESLAGPVRACYEAGQGVRARRSRHLFYCCQVGIVLGCTVSDSPSLRGRELYAKRDALIGLASRGGETCTEGVELRTRAAHLR